MKFLYILVTLVILVGGYVFFSTDETAEVETINVAQESESVSDGEMMMGDEEMDNMMQNDVQDDMQDDMQDGMDGMEEGIETGMMIESHETVEDMIVEKTFTLDSFSFGYSETEIRVKKGDTVTINLTNSDGLHDWVVDEFGAATEKIKAGDATSVTFVADEIGTFEYYCSVGSHRAAGMVGKLIVE